MISRSKGGARSAIATVLLGVLAMTIVACGSSSKSPAQSATSTLNKGLAAHVAGKLDEALKDYHDVLAKDPSNKFALYNIALIEQTRKQYQAADSDYRKALISDPNYVPALFNLAIVRSALNDDKGAVDLYRQVIALQPGYGAAHLNLGYALKKIGQDQEGQTEIQKGVQLDPSLSANAGGSQGSGSPSNQSTTTTAKR